MGLLGSWPALLTALTPPLLYFILAMVGLRWVSRA
jgi:lipopolysaccharide export system permease protein